jgi:peptidoglycan/LPS O-acetylase OafA/YrhL
MGILRLCLALVVVLGHAKSAWRPMDAGLAVELFFIISGFYMALVLDDKYKNRTLLFYSNRIERLFPTYLVVCAATIFCMAYFGLQKRVSLADYGEALHRPELWPIVLANLTVIGQDILCWFSVFPDHIAANLHFKVSPGVPGFEYMLIPQAWSIAFELMFYALAPFLVMRSTPFLVALASASLALRWAGTTYLTDVSYYLWPRRVFPAELCFFLFGFIAFRFRDVATKVPPWVGYAVAALLVAFIANHSALRINKQLNWALVFAAVTIAVPLLFETFRRSKLDNFIGELSYPVYIVHVLVIGYVLKFGTVAVVAVTLIAATALVFAIEQPMDKRRQRRVARYAIAPSNFGYVPAFVQNLKSLIANRSSLIPSPPMPVPLSDAAKTRSSPSTTIDG